MSWWLGIARSLTLTGVEWEKGLAAQVLPDDLSELNTSVLDMATWLCSPSPGSRTSSGSLEQGEH